MTTPIRVVRLAALAVMVAGCKPSPTPSHGTGSALDSSSAAAPPATAMVGRFAYADSAGAHLLALGALEDPSTIVGAVCGEGRVLPVRYDRRQTRQPRDNGRQVASNFANQEGQVFRLSSGSAPPDGTCYLSPDSLLLSNAVAARSLGLPACAPAHVAGLAGAKGRAVTHCWRIAEISPGAEVLAAQFATIDSSALASLVLIRDGVMFFHDFPAVAHGADESLWRVDDQGVFSPRDFAILFVARVARTDVLAVTWAGAEGESDRLLRTDSTGAFPALLEAYRYWAPN